jgi:hypothetical protein
MTKLTKTYVLQTAGPLPISIDADLKHPENHDAGRILLFFQEDRRTIPAARAGDDPTIIREPYILLCVPLCHYLDFIRGRVRAFCCGPRHIKLFVPTIPYPLLKFDESAMLTTDPENGIQQDAMKDALRDKACIVDQTGHDELSIHLNAISDHPNRQTLEINIHFDSTISLNNQKYSPAGGSSGKISPASTAQQQHYKFGRGANVLEGDTLNFCSWFKIAVELQGQDPKIISRHSNNDEMNAIMNLLGGTNI